MHPLDYFHNIDSHEKAYFLGLIYADGSISEGNYPDSKVFSIGLQLQDKYILDNLLTCIDANTQLYTHKNSVRLNLYDSTIYDDLYTLGVRPSKSYLDYNLPNIDSKYLNSFILGYFDGDGCVSIKSNQNSGGVTITCNSEIFLQDIENLLSGLGIYSYIKKITKPTGHLYVLYVAKKQNQIKFRDYIYKDYINSMTRKRDKFYKII